MGELAKLRNENKQLKALLKKAVVLLNKSKEALKHREKLAARKKKSKSKK